RLPVGAIEDINPSGLAGLCDAFARLPVDHGVEKNDRAGRVIVPEVVVHLLEMPGIFAGLGLQRENRGGEQIVPLAHRPVVVGAGIAGREIDQPELWIECRRIPDRASAVHPGIALGRPAIAADFAGAGYRMGPPQDLPGFSIERGQAAADPQFTSGDAAVDNALVVERGTGDAIAAAPLLD